MREFGFQRPGISSDVFSCTIIDGHMNKPITLEVLFSDVILLRNTSILSNTLASLTGKTAISSPLNSCE